MALSPELIESAMEMAIQSLSQVAATGTNDEKIAASRVLIEAAETYATQRRKDELSATVSPLIDLMVRNLAGLLEETDRYAPCLSLEPAQSGSLILSLTQQVNK